MKFSMDRVATVEDEDVKLKIKDFTKGYDIDSVIFTTATKSSVLVNLPSNILVIEVE